MNHVKRITISGLLVAIGVLSGSVLFIPIGVVKAFPVQHVINVLSGILLGPGYAVLNAFAISTLRNLSGTGTLLAFPGSMIGAFLAGYLYKNRKTIGAAYLGEVIGTGILGSVLASIMAKYMLGSSAGFSVFFLSFLASSLVGASVAALMIKSLSQAKILSKYVETRK